MNIVVIDGSVRVGQTLRVMQLLLTEVKLAAPDAVVETVALRSTRLQTGDLSRVHDVFPQG